VGLAGASLASPTGALAQAGWRLSENPTVVIGSIDGAAPTVFHDIRGAVAATDRLIVVADGGSRELRVFSWTGEFITAFGRDGDGPREFRGIAWIDMCGGVAIVAYDYARRRITKWSTTGELLDDFNVQGTTDDLPPYSVDCGPTGTFAVVGWPDVASLPVGVGLYRPDVSIGITDAFGQLDRVLGVFPGTERYRSSSNDRPHPLGKSTIARMGEDDVYVGTADSFAIQIVNPDGGRRSFGRDYPIIPMTNRMREQWVETYIRRWPAERRPALRKGLLDSDAFPSSLPAYSGFQLDHLGFVWVSPYDVPGRRVMDRIDWDVFDPDGVFVASVTIPRDFRPTEIGVDYLLGVNTDTLDVQRVHMYSLSR